MYTLQVDSVDGKINKVTKNVRPCTLDQATRKLIELIFSNDTFKEAMECMNLGGCVSVDIHSLSLFIVHVKPVVQQACWAKWPVSK